MPFPLEPFPLAALEEPEIYAVLCQIPNKELRRLHKHYFDSITPHTTDLALRLSRNLTFTLTFNVTLSPSHDESTRHIRY